MALKIETYNNQTGQNVHYKAISHPVAADAAKSLLNKLRTAKKVAIYDPLCCADDFFAFFSLEGINICNVYVQDVEAIGKLWLGHSCQSVNDMQDTEADTIFVIAYDANRLVNQISHLLPVGHQLITMDSLRLPDNMLTNHNTYLDPMNFATNFVFFRDTRTSHTRLVTTNYWARYGATNVRLWLRLFGENGSILAEWTEDILKDGQSILIDSQAVRTRFSLENFTGQLFIHAIGIAGHDTVKYALDIYGGTGNALSCTHDANAWPADLYAGLPAPRDDEEVVLWVQNSHPTSIPAGEIGLRIMGTTHYTKFQNDVKPFATLAVKVNSILPDASWPQQIEIKSGKHFVRPRYEVSSANGDNRIAHVNVERIDLKPDPKLSNLGPLLGKGYILPAPILPVDTWFSTALPTPMATSQANLPIALLAIDPDGEQIGSISIGKLLRGHSRHIDLFKETKIRELLNGRFGHMELVYDFTAGGEADGWLHSIFRFENQSTGHLAETSFGAHIFNTVLTYGDEPQSYFGRPPGLTTRLFLRLGEEPLETICHLIYPASMPWHAKSKTDISLYSGAGNQVAQKLIEIPCSGSRFWKHTELFDVQTRQKAGKGSYIIVRDATCRLFGYHGLVHPDGGFSLDHMFGF